MKLKAKYMPETMRVIHRCGGELSSGTVSVDRYVIHPRRPDGSPKGFRVMVVERIAPCGCSRLTGVKDARITSTLRMAIVPISDRDEVIRGWDDCTDYASSENEGGEL